MENVIKMGNDECPACKSVLNAVYNIKNGEKPEPKDITVCLYCTSILIFEEDMGISEFPPVLFDTLEQEEKIKIMTVIISIAKTFPPRSKELGMMRIENIKKYASRI